eukprot:4953070-Amphidinium_carterae.2
MSENYAEEGHIGKAVMQEFFTKTRLTEKQPGHRLWVNNKETRQTPPDLDSLQPDTIVDLTAKEEITVDTDPVQQETIPELPVQAPNEAVDLEAAPCKPTHRLVGKQPPPQHPVRAIVAQRDDIASTKELRLENNEDKEKNDKWSQS